MGTDRAIYAHPCSLAALFPWAKMRKQFKSINGGRDKQNVVYTCNGIFSILKRKEILTYATTCMNLEQIMLSEISQAKKTSAAWFHLCKVLSIVKLLESELEWWLLDTGEEKRSYCLMGILFQFYKIWRVLKMNGSKGNQQLDECI